MSFDPLMPIKTPRKEAGTADDAASGGTPNDEAT